MGTANTDHPKTLCLDHCWVCKAHFTDSGGKENRHEHHLVPSAYGGRDGPTVSLCDGHHNKLHRIAECLMRNKPHFVLLKGEPQAHVRPLMYLANVVKNAWLEVRNDPNKAASVMLVLNREQRLMIDKLKAVYPKAKSRPAVLAIALQTLYNKHFN